jgi:chromosome partitioning protein
MPKTICIANQKGGVGKTTTSINLAACLARAGKQTLLVDMDPQCNATTGLGQQPVDHHPLLREDSLRHHVLPCGIERLDLLPGSRRFRDVDLLANLEERQSDRVVEQLRNCTGLFDYVLIDCPPSMGRLTQTALASSDEVLMPIQCEYFAMEGLKQMIEVIRHVIQRGRGQLGFAGILLTMYDESLELTREVDVEVREFFGEIVFETVIPRDVLLSEAPSHSLSAIDYAPRSRGARAYIELCMEVLGNDNE